MADIGEKLRSAREAKGLSIEDVEKATKIQGRYLTAIEQNDFDKLPGDFYVRAFIRQYAQIVGLDGKQLLSEYHQEIPKAKPDEYVEESIDNKSEEVRKTTSNKKKIWQNYLPRIIVIIGVIAVVLVCYVVYAHFSSNSNQNNHSAGDVSVSTEKTHQPKKPKAVKKTNPVKIKKLATNQYQVTGLKNKRNLVVRAGDQATTIYISLNGVSQGAQTLAAGQKHTLRIPENAQSVVVTFTNALGTSVMVAGKKVPYNAPAGNFALTLWIGKRQKVEPETNQTQRDNGDTANNGATNNHTQTPPSQNHQSPTNNNHQSGTGQSTNQGNNQTDQNHGNNQDTNQNNGAADHNSQSGHSDSSSTEEQHSGTNDGR